LSCLLPQARDGLGVFACLLPGVAGSRWTWSVCLECLPVCCLESQARDGPGVFAWSVCLSVAWSRRLVVYLECLHGALPLLAGVTEFMLLAQAKTRVSMGFSQFGGWLSQRVCLHVGGGLGPGWALLSVPGLPSRLPRQRSGPSVRGELTGAQAHLCRLQGCMIAPDAMVVQVCQP